MLLISLLGHREVVGAEHREVGVLARRDAALDLLLALNHALPTVKRRSASSRVSRLSSAKSCVPPTVLPDTSQ